MSANKAGFPPNYLRTPEAARFVGLSIRTLEKHRIYGTVPRYSKLGGRIVYRLDDLQTWVERGEVFALHAIKRCKHPQQLDGCCLFFGHLSPTRDLNCIALAHAAVQ